jgi:hypothetical protein
MLNDKIKKLTREKKKHRASNMKEEKKMNE